ncbi:MAG: hypothetical protein QIT40_gp28 [Lokiarchaeia virus VerdaV4]|uniref:Uncharacterized protein n=1 Tax=Lokiarchaeia virus VerdaV4 TaxID=3070172 RepID=A0AA35CRN2_9CAUD|nr:MAG: hypothetical protein QIT40_gp28 [Lokiarchaeia virus VerdaV4]BDI54986.1 MAG: hypothetical protein [Lokiarchaeia virus VerdaV4]
MKISQRRFGKSREYVMYFIFAKKYFRIKIYSISGYYRDKITFHYKKEVDV